MDLFENLFKAGANFLKRKASEKESEYVAQFEDHFLTLTVLAQAACPGFRLRLRPVDGEGFLQGNTLALPTKITRFPSAELNSFCLFHKALMGGALHFIALSTKQIKSPEETNLLALHHLDTSFPGFTLWRQQMLAQAAEQQNISPEDSLWTLEQLPPLARQDRPFDSSASKRGRNKEQSEKESKQPGQVEAVDLDKQRKENNPVMHSFEKLETADEYKGGHRVTDASDQLADHAAALDELDLNKVTRSGDNAQSVYRAEISELFESQESALGEAKQARYLEYPEWDYKRLELKSRHCRLYVTDSPPSENHDRWREALESKYAYELGKWKQQYYGIMNERRWKDRQWDGSEVDVDSFVRYLADLRASGEADARVFRRRQRAAREFSTLVLIDQSYSTDSFVQGQRVLDTSLESVGLAGSLLEGLGDLIAVAGTWSETRSHCHFQLYKNFQAPWTSFYRCAPNIEPQGYTRLGPAIRHSIELLTKTGARTKLLILLTDGKPTDYDRYEGRYGMEDVHHAVLEAQQKGVELKALAIEKEAKRYFPALFGPNHYQILPTARLLPETLFRLYLEASKL